MSNFENLFKEVCERILNKDFQEDLLFSFSQALSNSSSRIRELLSTFGDKLEQLANTLVIKNPEMTEKQINRELTRRSIERIELISRTEISRLASEIKKNQAQDLGFSGFIWHTKKDKKVGEDHKVLEGAIFRLDDLPLQGFPQESRPNCRCQAEFITLKEDEYETIKRRQIARGIIYAN